MLSRRSFLAASLGLLLQPDAVLAAKKKKLPELKKLGPRTLSRDQWPPSISPDFISVVDKGYALLSDQAGRLVIVDLKRESGPLVIGELSGLGKKTVAMAVSQGRAYALAYQESGSDAQFYLVTLSILPSSDPTVISRIPLSYLSEPTSVSASPEALAIAGVGPRGENQVLLFPINAKRRPDESTVPSSTISFEHPVTRVEIQDRQMIVLQAGRTTYMDVFNLFNVRSPDRVASLKFDGNYPLLARTRDGIFLAGQNANRQQEVISVALRPTPRVVSKLAVPASALVDMAAQRGQLLVVTSQSNRQSVLPVTYNPKTLAMSGGEPASLPAGTRGASARSRIAVKEKEAFVVSDWGGVQVLSITKNSWSYLYSHTIPRLPAAAIAASTTRAVLAGADLKVYDISQPEKPVLLNTAEAGAAVRAVELVDNNILTLTREALTLRLMDRPGEVVSTVRLNGQLLAYDPVQRRALVLSGKDKNTIVNSIKVERGQLRQESSQEISGIFTSAAALNGSLLVSGLNNLALYTVAADGSVSQQPAASRAFPNLALRSLSLQDGMAVVTALDANSRGYLLTVNTLRNDLPTIGSIDVPQDAVAVAVSGKNAVVVGRGTDGKDIASLIDLTNPIAPKVSLSFPVLEAASAVDIRGQIALVSGRGLEILSLA